jgi:hypothetical protein
MPSWGPDLVNKLISISIRKNCIRMFFLSILQEEFLPCPVHPALFHNFWLLLHHSDVAQKKKIKMNDSI